MSEAPRAEGGLNGRHPQERPREPHWSRMNECTSAAGIRTLLFLGKMLGPRALHALTLPVLAGYWASNARLRRDVFEYQHRIAAALLSRPDGRSLLGIPGHPFAHLLKHGARWRPSWRSGLAQLSHFGDALADKFAASAGPASGLAQPGLLIENDAFFSGDAASQGCVLLTSHAGCQELLSREARLRTGHELAALQYTGHAERFNALLKAAGGEPPDITFFEVGRFTPALAMELSERVERGAYVILAGDRTPIGSEASASAPFLGAPARFPTGGALLAALLRCPLRMMTCTRAFPSDLPAPPAASAEDAPRALPDGRFWIPPSKGGRVYRVRFASISEAPSVPRRGRAEALAELIAEYARELEREILRSPLDWFNFFDFWKSA